MSKLTDCFKNALKLDDNAAAGLNASTTAADLSAWTSVNHLSLILEIEKAYGVRFANEEIAHLGSLAAIQHALESKGVSVE